MPRMSLISPAVVGADQISQLSVPTLCGQLRDQISASLGESLPVIVGIQRGGFYLAEWLHAELGFEEPLGALDISWHRDDLRASSVTPNVKPTALPVDIDGRDVLLVDDILYTGRTIRAALNELFDYGRPASVSLAVLGQRQGRQLPIAADYVAVNFNVSAAERVKLLATDAEAVKPVAQWQLLCSAQD